jgi:hypothetical protein
VELEDSTQVRPRPVDKSRENPPNALKSITLILKY